MMKGKGKGRATPIVTEDLIPVTFFGSITKSLKLLVEEAWHTNALLFNVGAEVTENTKLVGDVENLLLKFCRSQGLMGELPGESEGGVGEVARMPMPEWSPRAGGLGLGVRTPEPEGTLE